MQNSSNKQSFSSNKQSFSSNNMKIAIFDMDNLKNPFWAAGQARATREVGKILAKRHQITVYSSKYPGYKDYQEDGITYKHIGIVSNSPKLTNLFYILSAPLTSAKVEADIIVENFNAPISTLFIPLFAKAPVVGLPTIFAADHFSKKYHLPFDWIEKFGCKFYKYFLPYSEYDNDKIKKINRKVITKIVPQGVGKEYFNIKQDKPKFILFLGRFDIQQKGIDLLLLAYSNIAKKVKWPLVIAGHGPDEKKIKSLIKDLKLGKYVKMVGPVYGSKKMKLLSRALFVAFPSRHGETPLFAFEALASGLPIIAFNIDGLAWLNDKVALKAKPLDIAEYAKTLERACNEKVISNLRKNTRQFVKKYTWENVANQFEQFFQEILAREELKRKKLSLTVGITTCYGEESILDTVRSIRASKGIDKNFSFILIADRVPIKPEIKKELKRNGVRLIENKVEGSQFKKKKQILALIKTDLAVFTNDDVLFDQYVLQNLKKAFEEDDQLTMAGVKVLPLKPLSFFESIMGVQMRMHNRIIKLWNGSNNFLAASGRCLAYRTKHIKRFRIPEQVVNGDTYLYLENRRLGGRFKYVPEAKVYIRCPQTLKDQVGPSSRFQYSKTELSRYFNSSLENEYKIPLSAIVLAALQELVSNPIRAVLYSFIFFYTRFKKLPIKIVSDPVWKVDVSTKKINPTKI